MNSSIHECELHPHAWDESCDGCTAEMTARTAHIEQLQAEASNRAAGLAQNGIPFPPMALDMLKVQIIWENLFQGRAAYQAEEELGRRAVEMLKSMQSDATRASLLSPGAAGLHVVKDGRRT